MSVEQNVAFALDGPAGARWGRARAALEALGMAGFERRMPRTLSGGQQQRVALARALAREARLLLLDEPFSALDDALRRSLRRELLRLRAERGLSVLFVTHDLREAHLLADRLAVFDAGRILQYAPREEVFRRPLSRRVAELTGVANILRGEVTAAGPGFVEAEVQGVRLRAASTQPWRRGAAVDLAIRAERVVLRRVEAAALDEPNVLEMAVEEDHPYGSSHIRALRPLGAGPVLEVDLAARPYEVLRAAERRTWTVQLPPEDIHVMPVAPSEVSGR
jgi:ABC-type Fe3+/spermidine/putrescine transport system ATPase subunit